MDTRLEDLTKEQLIAELNVATEKNKYLRDRVNQFEEQEKKRGYHNGHPSECSLFQDGIEFALAAGQFKHVHELQNLFWILSGRELTIQP